MNSSGQTTVETLGALVFLSTSISVAIITAYIGFAHLWLSHLVHEGVICVAEGNSALLCKSKMLEGSRSRLPFGRINLAFLSSGPDVFRGQLNLQILGEEKWEIKKHYKISAEEIEGVSR